MSKKWDRQRGEWTDTPPGSSTGEVEAPGGATTAAISWEPPIIWEHACEESSGWSVDPLLPGTLHAHEQCSPAGSRAHTFKHVSPGGTTRSEQYTSPAAGGTTGKQKYAWRLRIARSRKQARVVEPYCVQCPRCHRQQSIMPDGRLFPHSFRETLSPRDRALYRIEHAGKEDMWRCPASYMHFGPEKTCGDGVSESGGESESEDESR